MNKFVLIDPRNCTVEMVEAEQLDELYWRVGLRPNEVDFGCIYRSQTEGWTLNVIVDERGLRMPPDRAKYFSLGGQLLEGGAIVFKAERDGETSSMAAVPPVMFYRSHVEVEAAIAKGEIARPRMSVNGEVVWTWPERPKMGG
jgi:hypothetical protein